MGRRCSPKLVFWLVEAVKWLPSNKHRLVMSKPEKKSSRPNVLNATPSTKVQVTSKVRTSIYFNFFLFHFVFYRLLVFALPVNLFFFFFFFGVCKFFWILVCSGDRSSFSEAFGLIYLFCFFFVIVILIISFCLSSRYVLEQVVKMQCKYMVGQLLLFSLVLISWLPIIDLWYRKMMRILLIFGGLI